MKYTLAFALLLWSSVGWSAAPATSPELPLAVKYTPASPAAVEAARAKLRPALTDAAALAALLGPDDDEVLKVGPFLGIEIDGDGLKVRKWFGRGRYTLPADDQMPPQIVESFGAQDRSQKMLVAHYVTLAADFSGPVTIREPDFEELALVWAWISWDLDGPLLVAESAQEKYFFDFDPRSGNITWIERLTHPCFSGSQEGKEILSCTCLGIDRNERSWRLRYDRQASCPAPGLQQVATAASSARPAPSALPVAYVRVGEKWRVDAMAVRRFTDAFEIAAVDVAKPGYRGPGKLLEGEAPKAPDDGHGKPLHGYVLMGNAIGPDGRMAANRILLSSDDRLSTMVLEAARTWRVEPATLDGKPVTEIIWQELEF